MATDDIKNQTIKIELDIRDAKKELEAFNKSIKVTRDMAKNIATAMGKDWSTLNKFRQKNILANAGLSVGQWNSLSSSQKANVSRGINERLQSELRGREAVEKRLQRLNQQSSALKIKALENELKVEKEITREKVRQGAAAERAAKEAERKQKAEDRAAQKEQERIANDRIAEIQARKRAMRSAVAEAQRGGAFSYVRGLSDPRIGSTFAARARVLGSTHSFKGAAMSQMGRLASQAMWRIQGAVLGAAGSALHAASSDSLKMEDWLSETQAIAGSTSGTMSQLAKSIYEVGSNSRFTTEELTKATTILAQAGYSAEDISKLLGSVNSLATATGTDLKTSVDLLTSSMSLWTSQTSDAARMVDALVVAVNTSKAEISSIQKGMQYAGAAASQMGMSFNETVAAMSAVTNAGLKTRSIMGTGLRAVLTELSDPSKKLQKELEKVGLTISDVNVRTKGFSNVIQTLADAGFGAENAFRGLDRQSASFYLALKSQLDLNNQLLETMERRGVAEKAEQVRMDTTIAQVGRLKNVWFEILSVAGSPVNSAFKFVVKNVADMSDSLASLMRNVEQFGEDTDSVIERTTAEIDSMKTSAQALAEEMWKLAQQNIGSDAAKASKAHANLTDRFNNERKVVQGLSQDYKQLKQYMLDIAVAQENERVASVGERTRANLAKMRAFPSDLSKSIRESKNVTPEQMLQLFKSVGLNMTGRSVYGVNIEREVAPKLQTMSAEKLQSLIYNLPVGSGLRSPLERFLTAKQNVDRGVTEIIGTPTGDSLRKELSSISNITDSVTKFMGGTQYKQLSDRLKDWSGANSQKDIATLLKTIDTFRGYMKTLDETANKYPQSIEIQTQTSTAREKLFENIQTLETQITNVATKAMEDIEKDLKNQSQTNKQGVIEKFMEKLEGMLGVSSSGKSWLDSTIEQLQNAKADEGLIEALKQLREKVLSGLLKSAEVAYKNTIESSKLSAGVSEAAQKYKKASGGYDSGVTALANLNYIQAQLTAMKDALESVKNARKTTYKEYSDEQFSSLTNPLEEQVVKLELDEKAATEEAARLGVYGDGFWGQTGNSMAQGASDFFNNINQQSAAYSLTLEGLNSVSSGLKTAFKSIAVEGMTVTQAFRSMAQSILQALANKAIDKGVDYLSFALGQALNLGGTAVGGSFGGANYHSAGNNYSYRNVTDMGAYGSNVRVSSGIYPGAIGGYVTHQGIRHFAIGGSVSGRDSVPAMLMPGEYVMKKSAVDMIGKETLDAMNQATSRASNDKASNVRESKKPSPVVTNVYVVQDKQDAGMTANDVVVAVSRDILQGGQTRQLIQQVVQGRY